MCHLMHPTSKRAFENQNIFILWRPGHKIYIYNIYIYMLQAPGLWKILDLSLNVNYAQILYKWMNDISSK